jgi:hypothetical protein
MPLSRGKWQTFGKQTGPGEVNLTGAFFVDNIFSWQPLPLCISYRKIPKLRIMASDLLFVVRSGSLGFSPGGTIKVDRAWVAVVTITWSGVSQNLKEIAKGNR